MMQRELRKEITLWCDFKSTFHLGPGHCEAHAFSPVIPMLLCFSVNASPFITFPVGGTTILTQGQTS